MATTLHPSHSYSRDRNKHLFPVFEGPPLGFAARAARGFQRACDALAQVIDISLTWVFLLGNVVLAASLVFMTAGQIAG